MCCVHTTRPEIRKENQIKKYFLGNTQNPCQDLKNSLASESLTFPFAGLFGIKISYVFDVFAFFLSVPF